MTIQQARESAEAKAGRKLTQEQFDEVLTYTRHKTAVNGHDEEYVPLLLVDEIKNFIFREVINHISHEAMAIGRMIDRERGNHLCASSAISFPA